MLTEQERTELRKSVEGLSISIKDKTVFSTRYGLYDGIYKSTSETGRIHGMSHEAVRLIINKVKKLIK